MRMENRLTTLLLITFIGIVILFSSRAMSSETIKLTKYNTILLNREVNPLLSYYVKSLKLRKDKKYYAVINTFGGNTKDMFIILDVLNKYKVTTITKLGYSAGAFIAQSNNGPRYILADGMLMFHLPYTTLSGHFNEIQLRLFAQDLSIKYDKNIRDITSRSRLGYAKLKYAMRNDFFVNAKVALDLGLMDKIVKIKCDKFVLTNLKELCP